MAETAVLLFLVMGSVHMLLPSCGQVVTWSHCNSSSASSAKKGRSRIEQLEIRRVEPFSSSCSEHESHLKLGSELTPAEFEVSTEVSVSTGSA